MVPLTFVAAKEAEGDRNGEKRKIISKSENTEGKDLLLRVCCAVVDSKPRLSVPVALVLKKVFDNLIGRSLLFSVNVALLRLPISVVSNASWTSLLPPLTPVSSAGQALTLSPGRGEGIRPGQGPGPPSSRGRRA
jgi:hypothetical protein